MTQQTAKSKRTKKTRVRALKELENDNYLRREREVYLHVGPLPDKDAGIVEVVPEGTPLGFASEPDVEAEAPSFTSEGFARQQLMEEAGGDDG